MWSVARRYRDWSLEVRFGRWLSAPTVVTWRAVDQTIPLGYSRPLGAGWCRCSSFRALFERLPLALMDDTWRPEVGTAPPGCSRRWGAGRLPGWNFKVLLTRWLSAPAVYMWLPGAGTTRRGCSKLWVICQEFKAGSGALTHGFDARFSGDTCRNSRHQRFSIEHPALIL